MLLIVTDRLEVEQGMVLRGPHIIISIRNPISPPPVVARGPLCRDVLYLDFDDAEPRENPPLPADTQLMSQEHARQIWRFVRQHLEHITIIVIHCEVGHSRSPAVAIAISRALGQDDSAFFEEGRYNPNRHVLRTMLATADEFRVP